MTRGQGYDYTAKSVEEAVDEGLRQLGVSRDEVDVEVVQEGSRGLLGIGASDAQVRLTLKETAEEEEVQQEKESVAVVESTSEDGGQPEASAEEGPAAIESVIEVADGDRDDEAVEADGVGEGESEGGQAGESELDSDTEGDIGDSELEDLAFDLLNQMMVHMGIEAEIELAWSDDPDDSEPALILNVVGDDLGSLIGRNGETLSSIQYLIRLMVNQELHRWKNIVVDIDGYKQRRAEQLSQLAHRLAEQVISSGRPASLEPMPASERRLVHIALRNHEQVYTSSTGEDTRRKVQILPR